MAAAAAAAAMFTERSGGGKAESTEAPSVISAAKLLFSPSLPPLFRLLNTILAAVTGGRKMVGGSG